MEPKTKKTLKILISALSGIGVSIASLLVFVILLFFSLENVLLILLCVNYISVLTFLVLWNKIDSKKVYLILSIPALCIAAGIAVLQYQIYIDKIPTVGQDISLYKYRPFGDDNLLAKLDGESHYKINDNLPILDGATALYPLYASFAEAVYPKADYSYLHSPVLCSKTEEAYDNLFEGKADIIFCAGPSEA